LDLIGRANAGPAYIAGSERMISASHLGVYDIADKVNDNH
jgi:hypothetical protein